MIDYDKLNECYDLLQKAIHKIPCNATTLDSCAHDNCTYYDVCVTILEAQEEISKLYLNE